MTASCIPESADGSAGTGNSEDAEPQGQPLTEVLDVRRAEVPGTPDAIEHFFGDL